MNDAEQSGAKKETITQARVSARQDMFLEAYARCGNITDACKTAEVGRTTHYLWLEDEDYCKKFADACAEYVDKLQRECDRRAIEGVESFIPGRDGALVRKVEYSDSLLMFRMKKVDPTYRERWSGEIKVKNVDNEAEMHAKLAATAEGRELIRRMSAIMEEGGE